MGILEQVPATVSAPKLGQPDFNGASAVVAKLPPEVDKEFTARLGLGEPMGLDDEGVEERGSFTLRKANPESGFISLAAYDKLDHPIKCTLKGYRRLGGAFHGQLVYTGYKKVWKGQKQR